ncbi:MAG TPA: hypothetical protein HA254_01130 [Candidatus Diapherotrites archaeon]|uniref:Uncharacterized protein n=1 Tax=Candidatus Iainarchaeum sp. TaxID=3101447 RepID=A0A7J4IUQ9_9ARCH|nr:hypothetical protein [Candidatus Diapherotrites archaeon]
MLDFILSKLNLLILVTAIFAIVAFFTFSLTDIAKVKEASELASRVREMAFSLATSDNYCIGDSYPMPGELAIAGSSFYYVAQVTKQELETQNGPVNVLIFSIYPREEMKKWSDDSSYQPKAIAADSLRTTSELHLYSPDYHGDSYDSSTTDLVEAEKIILDPQAVMPSDAVEALKEIVNGKSHVYIFGCNSKLCESYKSAVGESVHPKTPNDDGGFEC